MSALSVWIPTNRRYKSGKPKAMDGLNEIIRYNRTNVNMAARIEREDIEWCSVYIKQAMLRYGWKPMRDAEKAAPVVAYVTFVEANYRRDRSNIVGGGLKYLLDALTRTGAIYDDSPRWLTEEHHQVIVDPESVGIQVLIARCEDD